MKSNHCGNERQEDLTEGERVVKKYCLSCSIGSKKVYPTSFELSLPDGAVDLADGREGRHVVEVAGHRWKSGTGLINWGKASSFLYPLPTFQYFP